VDDFLTIAYAVARYHLALWIVYWCCHYFTCYPQRSCYFYASVRQDWQVESWCSPPVRSSICSSVNKLVNMTFWQRTNWFCHKLAQVVHGLRAWNELLWGSRGQRSKSHDAEKRFGGLPPWVK